MAETEGKGRRAAPGGKGYCRPGCGVGGVGGAGAADWEQEAELAEVQTKVAQQKQKKKEKNAKVTRRERLLPPGLRSWRR
ncbi:hypothetical protein [Saccharopolyspora spinosa]|uniref:hypothetical protein n=1 Tax=Saccharopolyspora spinosa TaxID=60894 RepID=UPI00376EDD63